MSRKKKAIEKEIDCLISIKNNHWNAFILTLAGSLGLVFISFSILKWILIAIGIGLSLLFFWIYLNQIDRLFNLVKKLEEK